MVEEEKVDVQRQSPRSPLRQGAKSEDEALVLRELKAREISNVQRKAYRDAKLAAKRKRISV